VQTVFNHILAHPDVKIAMGGSRAHNLNWHLRRNSLVNYLEHVEQNLPAFASFLLTCVKSYQDNSLTTKASSLTSFLDSQSKSKPMVMDFQQLRTNHCVNGDTLDHNRFFTYFLHVQGYEDHFNCGKVYSHLLE